MKAILVIDMPDVCCSSKRNCDLCVEKDWGFICAKTGRDVLWGQMPDWCPLRLVPDKCVKVREHDLLAEGWNACIDAILQEEERA